MSVDPRRLDESLRFFLVRLDVLKYHFDKFLRNDRSWLVALDSDFMHKDTIANLMILGNVMSSLPKLVTDYRKDDRIALDRSPNIMKYLSIIREAGERTGKDLFEPETEDSTVSVGGLLRRISQPKLTGASSVRAPRRDQVASRDKAQDRASHPTCLTCRGKGHTTCDCLKTRQHKVDTLFSTTRERVALPVIAADNPTTPSMSARNIRKTNCRARQVTPTRQSR